MDLSELRWNSSGEIVKLVAELEEVLARPLKVPVRSFKQAQRRLEPAEVAELVAAYRGGDSMKTLAKRHGIHRTTVAHWLYENAVDSGGKASQPSSCQRLRGSTRRAGAVSV